MSATPSPDSAELSMPAGSRYAGEPMDISSRRSVSVRGGTVKDADPVAIVDYFYHDDRYWTARIPLDGVAEVFGQAFNFSRPRTRKGPSGPEVVYDEQGIPKRKIPILNHVQSRFVLNASHAVELFPLHQAPEGEPAALVRDFVYSIEAVGPPGVTFNLRDGLSGSLVSAHRFLSTEQMVFERIVVENQAVTQTPALPLDPSSRQQLLAKSLMRSHAAGDDEKYYLLRPCGTNNCTSNPFRILDDVVTYSPAQRIGAMLYRFPLNPRLYLRLRGLDANPRERHLVRNEFAAFVGEPAVQQRKRDHVRRWTKIRRALKNRQRPA